MNRTVRRRRALNHRGHGVLVALLVAASTSLTAQQVAPLWPGPAPGESGELPPEADTTKPGDNLVAGRPVMRIGNVSTPTLTMYPAPRDKANGASVIICPGGGHHILAWDLEGTEVAQWLNGLGVTAFILKYRVPAREKDPRWRAAVQDAQRAVSLVHARARDWTLNPERIGILGFSAGGETAALTALFAERTYPAVDDMDKASHRPDFAILVYGAGIVDRETRVMHEHIRIDEQAPPTFLAHAYDDGVPVENSVQLFLELKRAGVPAELHVYDRGGHGYGLRETDTPVTTWHHRCADWMRASGWLKMMGAD